MKLPDVKSLLSIDKETPPTTKEISAFDPTKLSPKEVYLSWQAPSKSQSKQQNKKLYKTFLIIGVLIGLLLAVMGEYYLILLIASLIFVFYAANKVEPEILSHEISSHGFSYSGQLFYWHKLKHFFFADNNFLIIDTYDVYPARLFVIYKDQDKDAIKKLLEAHIQYLEKPVKNTLESFFDTALSKLNF